MDDPVSRDEHERVLRENVALREQIECLRKDTKTLVTLLLSPCEHGEEPESTSPAPEPACPGTTSWRKPGTGTGMIINESGQDLQEGSCGYYLPFGEPHGEVPN